MTGQGWVRGAVAFGLLAFTTLGTGCGSFFTCEGKTSCGASSSTSASSNNVVYVANQSNSALYAYQVGTGGTLTGVSGSPFTLTAFATAMAVTPDNSVLYVAEASVSGGAIVSYPLDASTGVPGTPTQQATGSVQTTSLAVSPDGKWLLAMDANNATTTVAPALRVYSIGTAGALGNTTQGVTPGVSQTLTLVPYQVVFSADSKYVALALGTDGVRVYPFTTSTGSLATPVTLDGGSNGPSDNGVVFDSSDSLYVAQSGSANGVTVFATGFASGATGKNYSTGTGPRTPTFANSGAYLYTANIGDGTITSFANASQVLTPLASATSASLSTQQLLLDKSGTYLLAAGITGGSGLQSFSIASGGALTLDHSAATGTLNGIPVMAATNAR